jgi:hypothetical protein
VEATLQRGAERARAIARPLLARLREAVGLRRSRLLSTPSTPAPKNEAPPLVKQYREADGLFYVKLTQGDEVLLLSPGFAQGRDAANERQLQQFTRGDSAAQQFQSLIGRQNDAFLKGFQDAYAGANNALAQGARVAEEQARRLEMLRPTSATVNVADIRTAEGQALVQDVAAQAQDPALIEARLQTRLLNAIASGITGAASNYFNQPVAIVGAARMG